MTDYYIPPFEPVSRDITFCLNDVCPFDKCKRKLENYVAPWHNGVSVSVADLTDECRTFREFSNGKGENKP